MLLLLLFVSRSFGAHCWCCWLVIARKKKREREKHEASCFSIHLFTAGAAAATAINWASCGTIGCVAIHHSRGTWGRMGDSSKRPMLATAHGHHMKMGTKSHRILLDCVFIMCDSESAQLFASSSSSSIFFHLLLYMCIIISFIFGPFSYIACCGAQCVGSLDIHMYILHIVLMSFAYTTASAQT